MKAEFIETETARAKNASNATIVDLNDRKETLKQIATAASALALTLITGAASAAEYEKAVTDSIGS